MSCDLADLLMKSNSESCSVLSVRQTHTKSGEACNMFIEQMIHKTAQQIS